VESEGAKSVKSAKGAKVISFAASGQMGFSRSNITNQKEKLGNFGCGFFLDIPLQSIFNGYPEDLCKFLGYWPVIVSGAAVNGTYE